MLTLKFNAQGNNRITCNEKIDQIVKALPLSKIGSWNYVDMYIQSFNHFIFDHSKYAFDYLTIRTLD